MLIKRVTSAVLLFWGACAAAEFSPEAYLNHVKYLASDSLKGRGTGAKGLDKAADYIARQFRRAGLKPAGGNGYFQWFDVTVRAEMGSANKLGVKLDTKTENLKRGEDFLPFNFSSTARTADCPVVFAGYGITAKEYNYDDYAAIDVKDKCVLILRYEPQEFDEKSVFSGKSYTEHAQLPKKAFNARNHGARAVILVNNMAVRPSETDRLEKFGNTSGPANGGIPFVQMKYEIAERWIKAAGKDLKETVAAMDKELAPHSFALPASLRVELETEVRNVSKRVRNVVGYAAGETEEYVVIGAHYDHLGLGDQHSLAPSQIGKTHYGADDNASGAAGLIELARHFTAGPKHKRGVLLIAFAGEELGLLGSSFYVNQPLLPIERAVAMINMDMIGRVQNNKIYVGGSGTGSTLQQTLEAAAKQVDLTMDVAEKSGYGSSDHTSFTTKQVPVLFFFSGLHADYHKPSDTWDKIQAPGAAKVLKLVASVTEALSSGERPLYVKVEPPKMPAGTGGGGSGYGPYFGSIPDFAEIPNGVKFSDVRAGSPAAKAGLKGGDILIEFDGKAIQNLYDYTYALRAKKPGDVVMVKVLRGGQPVEAKVELAERK